jgi:hypothetical protein
VNDPAPDQAAINDPLYRRARRNMIVFLLLALVVAALYSGWHMARGVALGGALSFFNLRWLTASLRGILNAAVIAQDGKVPPFTAGKFVLRYYVIAVVIGLAVWTGNIHPLGIGIGFFAFVAGVMLEAAYRLYLILTGQDFSE